VRGKIYDFFSSSLRALPAREISRLFYLGRLCLPREISNLFHWGGEKQVLVYLEFGLARLNVFSI
jgi:hypothetical protein